MSINQQEVRWNQNQRADISGSNGDVFGELYGKYRDRLLHSMTAMVRDRDRAEDITAAAFSTALEKLDRFRGESSLYTWVHTIALNEARGARRGNRIVPLETLENQVREGAAKSGDLIDTLERAECRARLRRILRRIPSVHRRMLVDHFVKGLSTKRIARMDGLPLGTVLTRIFRAKKVLRRAWSDAAN